MSSNSVVSICQETMTILANFARINPGLRFNIGEENEGSKLISIDPSKALFAHAVIKEVLPQEFFIYDLTRFLNILKHPAFKDGTIEFNSDYLTLTGLGADGKKVEIVYHYSDDRLDYFKGTQGYNDLPLADNPIFSANISKEQLDNFLKAASALEHEFLILKNENGISSLIASSSKNTKTSKNLSSDDYTQHVNGLSLPDSETCFPIKMLKIIPGDYTFNVIEMETSDGDDLNVLLAKNSDFDLNYMITESP